MKLTKKQRAYIIAHKNDYPRQTVAEAIGVSVETVRKVARANGGEALTQKVDGLKDYVRSHYQTTTGTEIAAIFGCTKQAVYAAARQLGIKHSPEFTREILRSNRERLVAIVAATKEQRIRKWKTRRRLDQMRIFEGKPQETKLRFREMPKRAYRAKWRLIHLYGYIPADGSPYILHYNSNTSRRTSSRYGEAHFETRYHFRFEPAEATVEDIPQDRQVV